MYIKTSELHHLDVVNIEDGRILGNVCDIDLDPSTGELRCLILAKPELGLWRFIRHNDLEIPWSDVVIVGIDVVLVKTKLEQSSKSRAWQR